VVAVEITRAMPEDWNVDADGRLFCTQCGSAQSQMRRGPDGARVRCLFVLSGGCFFQPTIFFVIVDAVWPMRALSVPPQPYAAVTADGEGPGDDAAAGCPAAQLQHRRRCRRHHRARGSPGVLSIVLSFRLWN
jgi:hypothetical protein